MTLLADKSADAGSNVVRGAAAQTKTFTMPGDVALAVQSVAATITNGAASAVTPTLIVREADGTVIVEVPADSSIPAGDSGVATWALRLGGSASDTSGGTPSGPIGTEVDFVQRTTSVTVSGGFGTETTVLTGNPIAYDGATTVKVEFDAAIIDTFEGATYCVIDLYEDAAVFGILGEVGALNSGMSSQVYRLVYVTPSVGTHTYTLKAYKVSVGGGAHTNPVITAGSGGVDFVPAFMRISKA